MTVRHTPGHTPEHVSYEIAEKDSPEKPWGVLTGDSLFVSSAGRPDLLGSGQAKKLAALGGLLGHWQTAGAHWQLTQLFLLAAIAGMFAGLPLAKRISAAALNRTFAVFVFAIGLFVIGRTLFAAH